MNVSVIIPCYNHQEYIGDAIRSVLDQTHEQFELIVIDDASEDNSWDEIKSFSDKRIRASRLPANHGAYFAQNKGLELAQYEFIAILNSDDKYLPNRLHSCLETIQEQRADMVGSSIQLIDSTGQIIYKHWWIDYFTKIYGILLEDNDWLSTMFAGNLFMTSSNFFFRRSILEKLSGFNDFIYVPDYEFLLRTIFLDYKFSWIETPLLQYRIHSSNTIYSNAIEANKESSKLIRQFLPRVSSKNKSISKILHNASLQLTLFEKYMVEELHLKHKSDIAEKDVLISERDKWIVDRNYWIAERDELLKKSEKRIIERDEWVATRDHQIAERDKWITERDEWIATRDHQIAERDKWIAERDEIVKNMEKAINQSYKNNDELTNELSFIKSGLLYKINRFLRRIYDF